MCGRYFRWGNLRAPATGGGLKNKAVQSSKQKIDKNKSMKINWRSQPLVGDVLRPIACSEVQASELMIDGSVSVA